MYVGVMYIDWMIICLLCICYVPRYGRPRGLVPAVRSRTLLVLAGKDVIEIVVGKHVVHAVLVLLVLLRDLLMLLLLLVMLLLLLLLPLVMRMGSLLLLLGVVCLRLL